jgi:hypothetical protein
MDLMPKSLGRRPIDYSGEKSEAHASLHCKPTNMANFRLCRPHTFALALFSRAVGTVHDAFSPISTVHGGGRCDYDRSIQATTRQMVAAAPLQLAAAPFVCCWLCQSTAVLFAPTLGMIPRRDLGSSPKRADDSWTSSSSWQLLLSLVCCIHSLCLTVLLAAVMILRTPPCDYSCCVTCSDCHLMLLAQQAPRHAGAPRKVHSRVRHFGEIGAPPVEIHVVTELLSCCHVSMCVVCGAH